MATATDAEPHFAKGGDLDQGNDLPEDALLRICELTETENLVHLAETCRRFYAIILPIYYERHKLPMEGYGVGNIDIQSMVLFRVIPKVLFLPPINRLKTSLRFPCVTVPELLLQVRSTLTHIYRVQELYAKAWQPPPICSHELPPDFDQRANHLLPYSEQKKREELIKQLSKEPPPTPPKLKEFTLQFQPEYAGNRLFRLLLENSMDRKVELRNAFQKLFLTIFSTVETFTLKDGKGMPSLLDPKSGYSELLPKEKGKGPEAGPSPLLTRPVTKNLELHSPIFFSPLLRKWGASFLSSSSVVCLSIKDPGLEHAEWAEWFEELNMPTLETLIIDRCSLRVADLCKFLNNQPSTHTLHLHAPLSEDHEFEVPNLAAGAPDPPKFFVFEHVKTLISLPDYLNQFLGPKYDFKCLEEVIMSMWVDGYKMFQWDTLLPFDLDDPTLRSMENITLTLQLRTELPPPRRNPPPGVEHHDNIYWLGGGLIPITDAEKKEKVMNVLKRINKAKLKWFSLTAPNAVSGFYYWLGLFPNIKMVEFVGSVKSEMWAHHFGVLRKQHKEIDFRD